ncbi:hypothetical protein RSOLAG22IIIB_09202 [Rhizoctonia solani]|uniref:Uncharacterized protein n=1 Tax=Rhizoctonia solani TaxID=456999 RepID=A0A0K6FXV3_9AGAM|nr:hypothetical protein RSOLAG22IIIB_09202 [Rhizoctonia solani]
MKELCELGNSNIDQSLKGDPASHFTLEKLRFVLELTRFPGELNNFTLPGLVVGCILLMNSIRPSPFFYEYGYLCFRILVIALDTCWIQHGRNPTEPLQIPNHDNGNDYLSALCDETTLFIGAEIIGQVEELIGMSDMPPGLWTAARLKVATLDALLALLHADRKHFTIALRDADSLGLCGLMYVLLKYVEDAKASMSEAKYQETLYKPYVRVFCRYYLVIQLSTADNEEGLRCWTNVIEAYCSRIKAHEFIGLEECMALTVFVAPFVIHGCEDLISDMLDASLQLLWNSMLVPDQLADGGAIRVILWPIAGILERLDLSRTEIQPWSTKFVDTIINSDLIDLILRIMLLPAINHGELHDGSLSSDDARLISGGNTLYNSGHGVFMISHTPIVHRTFHALSY